MRVKKIAIIGGGTAGWLAANHLAVELRAEQDVTITVIESPEIGIIGVGEGTVPHIRKSLMKFGISEAELLASCDTTFKVGIKFVDWMAPDAMGRPNSYYHPFASPYPSGIDTTSLYLQQSHAMEFSAVTEVPGLADAMKSPKEISSAPFEGPVNYAYHFNAVKFGAVIGQECERKIKGSAQTGPRCLRPCLNEQGEVDYLLTQEGEKLYFDFYVDCSGFHSLLLGKLLQVPFVDKSDQILTDSALAVQIPTEAGAEIPPYTLAQGAPSGMALGHPLDESSRSWLCLCQCPHDGSAGAAGFGGSCRCAR